MQTDLDSPIGKVGFDWLMTALSAWLLGGIVLDNWAHNHQQLVGKLETFFTPWHAVLYSGSLAVAVPLVAAVLRNRRRGHGWRCVLPAGYGLSLLGVPIFICGGLFDMIWHTVYGIEIGIDATYSPPHLILGAGWVLIVSGPLRAAWWRTPESGWLDQLPMVLSLAFTLSIVSFYTGFAQPLMNPWAAANRRLDPPDLVQALGVASILLHTGVLMGLLLLSVLRVHFPLGGLTLLFIVSGTLMAAGSWPEHSHVMQLTSATLTGIAADLLLTWLRPSSQRPAALRVFAFAVPVIFYVLHFAMLKLTVGIWWSVHLWAGSIALASTLGVLISYAFVPPGHAGAGERDKPG